MGITKKISPIKRSYPSDFATLESSLANNGYHRFPGTKRTFLPFKDGNRYRTGLDENALYLQKLPKEERDIEIERIRKDKARLEENSGFNLSATSTFYNYGANLPEDQKVSPVKIGTQDKFFNIDNVMEEITWNWIRVHPNIAPSMDAVRRGDVHPDVVQYYIADDEAEIKNTFLRKQKLNKAVQLNEGLTPTKRKQVARLMGLPVTEQTKEEQVYNLIDNALKEGEFTSGEHKGLPVIQIFTDLVTMKDDLLKVKELIDQAIAHSIYRVRGNGRIYEGDNELSDSKASLIKYFMDDKNQEELFGLEKKLSFNKLT